MGANLRFASNSSARELSKRERFEALFEDCPIPPDELLSNLLLFVKRQDLTRMIFLHDLYRRALEVNGVVMEFGVRWGRDLALFESFRGMYEPYNYGRKVIGFDTFEGFPSVHAKDGGSDVIEKGAYSVTEGYEDFLREVLDYHESESPIPHIQKYELVKGDVTATLPRYLEEHPETVVALAYFDLDVYEPTKACLEAIKPHLTKGSVLGFDEVNCEGFPGETLALKEVLGLDRYSLRRSPIESFPSWLVIE